MSHKFAAGFACTLLLAVPATVHGQSQNSTADEAVERGSEQTREAVDRAKEAAEKEPAASRDRSKAPETRKITLFSTGNTGGSLATPRCRKPDSLPDDELHYARLVRAWDDLVQSAEDEPRSRPIAMHLGDSVYPGPIGRFLLARDVAPEGASRLAGLLQRIPYAAHVLGNAELGLEPAVRTTLLEAADQVGLRLRAANLVCTPETGGEAVCETLGTAPNTDKDFNFDVVERGGLNVAVVSLLDPAVGDRVASSRLAGLRILSPESELKRAVEQVEEANASGDMQIDMVVAQFHAADDRSHRRSMELAQAVSGVDVVMTNAALPSGSTAAQRGDDRGEENGYAVVPGTGTVVIGTAGGPSSYVTSTLTLTASPADNSASTNQVENERDWSIDRVDSTSWSTEGLAPDPATAESLTGVAADFCDTWGRPVSASTTLAEPMDREAFKTYVLNTMRFSAQAEVALMNDGALANAATFPIRQDLTLADIYTALPYNNELVVARVSGKVLAEWAGKIGGPLAAVGLTADGKINGRAIHPNRQYRVATNRYVFEGGDDLVDADAFKKSRNFNPGWADGAPPISEVVVHYLQSGAFRELGTVTDRIDPTGNFPDLSRKLFWSFTGSLNASYDQIVVDNPGESYTQSQLTNNDTQQVNLELSGAANADSRNHGWDNSLLLQYARARVSQDGQAGSFEETKDLIRGKSAYKFTGIRADLGNAWWAPIPTVELQIESEFDAPEQRAWHKLELTGIAGATFRLFDPFEVTIGANVRGDANAPEAETLSGPVSGLAASYQLERIDLLPLIGSPIKFESELEYFYNDIRRDDIHELRSTNRLYYSLFQDLYFTSTFSAFLYQNTREVGDLGSHTELTFGLNYLWDASVQTF